MDKPHMCVHNKESRVKERSQKGMTVLYILLYCECGKSIVGEEEFYPDNLYQDFLRALNKSE